MLKRICTTALAAVLALSAVGCGSGSGGNDGQTEISISVSDQMNKYILQSPDINEDKWVKELNEGANVKVTYNFLDHKRFSEQIQLMYASADITDVVIAYDDWRSPMTNDAIENGAFQPLTALLENGAEKYPNLMSAIPEKAWENSKMPDGEIYGIPVVYKSIDSGRVTYIRKDLLEKYNLEIPVTIDDFVNVLRVFKENGMKYPFAGREKWSYTDLFIAPFGVDMNRFNLNEKGEMVPDIIRPEFKEAIAFNRKLYEEGLMNPESLMMSGTDWSNKIKAGEIGMFMHDSESLSSWNLGLKANVPDGEFTIIPSPVGYNGSRGAATTPTIVSSLYINAKYKTPEKVLEYLDYLCREDVKENLIFGGVSKEEFVMPTSEIDVAERDYRRIISLVYDNSYNKYMLPFAEDADVMQNYIDNIAEYEGYHSYKADKMESFDQYPDLIPGTACNLWQEYAAKIFYGEYPVSAYDEFVAEYLKRGGQAIVDEATKLYQAGEMVQY